MFRVDAKNNEASKDKKLYVKRQNPKCTKLNQNRDGVRGQKSTIVKLFEQGKNICC